jgi:mannose-6-phosphate isomerase
VRRLENEVMGYDWGSRTAIAELQGRRVPSEAPEAELWIGAHASAPSRLPDEGITLADTIARSPQTELGAAVCARFGGRMPFLLKVLAADVPLSLQAHPDAEQARAGFAREEARGVPVSARHRCYRDDSHKPELLCALGPFEGLCGFRPYDEMLALVSRLGVGLLAGPLEPLRRDPGPDGLRAAFGALFTLAPDRTGPLVAELAAACRRESERGSTDAAQLRWIDRLAERHPGDAGVVASLLLNHVQLESGDAIALRAGVLHSYLRGTGIEIMASSDNVLRGGLTTKHVDVDELLAILDFRPTPCVPVEVRAAGSHEIEYVTDFDDFRLSRIELQGDTCQPARRGPELLLCVDGCATARGGDGVELRIGRGEAVFVSAGEGPYTLTGESVLFRATAGDVAC